ncbi:hypothetical protein T08_9626 [Trichinella sp. T8]|nr:hypothetical protein T08_9626 [Trichinella sp. T8]
MKRLLYELTKKFSSTEFDIEHSIMQIMIVTKVPYHLQRCSRSFDLRAQWKHMNNGEKRILNAVYMEQKVGVTKHNNRMQELLKLVIFTII